MLNRRQILLGAVSSLLFPPWAMANSESIVNSNSKTLDWIGFKQQMELLSRFEDSHSIAQNELSKQGLDLLSQLDINSSSFKNAVEQSYESGNRYWLWQRLMKRGNINGGILNIDQSSMVQLHDHPGATGMVRIISGAAEVWLFDENKKYLDENNNEVELMRVSRKILTEGDTAVLSPNKGNIHALRSISKECRMLDFFIPPYQRSQRSWFEPLADNWFDQKNIRCRKISQNEYTLA
ncbi:hypothetical protein [sulfur-oxidizing endosymbiont of Gigantopelta aegis]|uniref:hypothetical protein n=1 Tax=sulfur-oxidizing endosymbiont of Gigantopelta aegis TaxID=2794934 RepID=UPI0018DDFD71|nr:hypothetical protein [sulfur-oxidizing endosymbiont of Gigantopelta aegis]